MTTTETIRRFDDLPTNYAELVAMLMPRPIHNQVECDNATEIIDLMAGHELSGDQEDYLDLISDLVAAYEERNSPVRTSEDPLELLQWLLEEHGMNASDLGRLLGDRSLGSRILSGDRALSKTHIRILADRFKVSPAVFI